MRIEIKNRFNGKIIIRGEYKSIKHCLEENRAAYFEDADLRDADLGVAYLGGAYFRGADLVGTDLRGADLRDADLRDTDLKGADFEGTDLVDADFRGAKNYVNHHHIFAEAVRRQEVATFTEKEWAMIGVIIIHSTCWDTIKKRFGKKMLSVFRKLSQVGFNEWEKHYKQVLEG